MTIKKRIVLSCGLLGAAFLTQTVVTATLEEGMVSAGQNQRTFARRNTI